MDQSNQKPEHQKSRRIVAIVCIALLVAMYVATFIVACLNFPGWDRMFQACIVLTIGMPILLWIYMALYKRLKR